MFNTYSIYITFRGESIPAVVHDHTDHQLIYSSHPIILDNFTGCIELKDGEYVKGHQRNPDAKDIGDLVRAIKKQLRSTETT